MRDQHYLLFASDATLAAVGGVALLLLALLAWLAEHRRSRRRTIDAVGWVPWTAIFLAASFCAATLLALALEAWIRG